MLTTAARVGAVLDLKWDRVDFPREHIRLAPAGHDNAQGAGDRADQCHPDGGRFRMPRKGARTDHVIEWNGEPGSASIKTGFKAAVVESKLSDVSPHVLAPHGGRLDG